MNLSHDELMAKHKEYDEAGKFDYLKSFRLVDIDLSVRGYNSLKSNGIKSLYDFINIDISNLNEFRNFGKRTQAEVAEKLLEYNSFMLSGGNYGSQDFPTFENFYSDNKLDAYLTLGETLADKIDPQWREKLDLPLRPKKSESELLKDFIRAKAQADFTPEQKNLLLTPVDELPLVKNNALAGLTDNGVMILAQVVYNDANYLIQQGVSEPCIFNVIEDVKELGFTDIGFRKNAQDMYQQQKRLQHIQATQQEYADKLGLTLNS